MVALHVHAYLTAFQDPVHW